MADRTIDRVARKLAEGERIREDDPSAYFLGFARNILREFWSERSRERAGLQKLDPDPHAAQRSADIEDLHRCLERCLARLSPESRDLLLRYYQGRAGDKIQNRKAIAARLGIPLNALRIRTHRLRARVEACVRECQSETRAETESPIPPRKRDA